MDLDLVFFGTSGSMPTAQRAPSALLVRRGGERLLFDCAEGTQRQMLRSTVGLVELREIFLTHYHADHFLGLPGMLKTFALRGRELLQAVPFAALEPARDERAQYVTRAVGPAIVHRALHTPDNPLELSGHLVVSVVLHHRGRPAAVGVHDHNTLPSNNWFSKDLRQPRIP